MTADPVKTLMTEGYCVLEGAVPTDTAAELEQRCRDLHLDPANQSLFQDPNDDLYQTLFSLANLEEATWEFAAHPDVLVETVTVNVSFSSTRASLVMGTLNEAVVPDVKRLVAGVVPVSSLVAALPE
jgi:hypothetical protein